MRTISIWVAAAYALVTPTLAQFPYTPTRLILSSDETKVYQLSVQNSQLALSVLSTDLVTSSQTFAALDASLPTQSSPNTTFLSATQRDSFLVLAGNCQDTTTPDQLWRFTPEYNRANGTWNRLTINEGTSSKVQWLSAGFTFAPTTALNNTSLYIFGGMCPNLNPTSSTWTSDASYSNSLLTASPSNAATYGISAASAPPVAEAGLTITPLQATYTTTSSNVETTQQNFLLLGGHTQNAFINMSQVAIYSLPQATWNFVSITQPSSSQSKLARRDSSVVEPRSGHTAILSEDGSKIIIFGGWVGDIATPADPQLAILNLATGYGGSSTWSWSIPAQTAAPFVSGQGIYGHGAVMLPGGVMMIAGGTILTLPTSRQTTVPKFLFYNVTSSTWLPEYQRPDHVTSIRHGLNPTQKAGLGAGIGLGLTTIILIATLLFLYFRRQKRERLEREKRLREAALGSGRYQSYPTLHCGVDGKGSVLDTRSLSGSSNQMNMAEIPADSYPWAPILSYAQSHSFQPGSGDGDYNAWNSRDLRRSLHSKGPTGFGNHFGASMTTGPGHVFRIDEEEEGSIRSGRANTPSNRISDPFKDPPSVEIINVAAEERKKEVQGWVEDWQSAAESMTKDPIQGRTYSNLSQAHSMSNSNSDRTGRLSPEKSDRTGSNLSDRSAVSMMSVQRSVTGTVSRTISQRSVSAGYALFAGAAAAMSKFTGSNIQPPLERSASKRSVSLNGRLNGRSVSVRPQSSDGNALLRDPSPAKSERNGYWTPPESPIKDYKNYARTSSLTSQSRKKTRGVLGSFKRVLTGTSQVDVQAQVEHYEEVEKEAEVHDTPEIIESKTPHNNPAGQFWQGKKGARDWNDDTNNKLLKANDPFSLSVMRRRSSGRVTKDVNAIHNSHEEEYDGEDWDVETAIQKRVVQVMFTVPKEKLRVVNADALSLMSRSDVGGDDGPEIGTTVDIKRMSSVKEGDNEDGQHLYIHHHHDSHLDGVNNQEGKFVSAFGGSQERRPSEINDEKENQVGGALAPDAKLSHNVRSTENKGREQGRSDENWPLRT